MKSLSIIFVFLLAACGPLDPSPGPSAPGLNGGASVGSGGASGPVSISEGQALYAANCAICHGSDGTGAPPYPATIRGAVGIATIVREGRGEMPGLPAMSDSDIAALELFLAEAPGAPAGMPMERYAGSCAPCHGATGEGNERGPQLRSPVHGYASWIVRNGRPGIGYADAMPGYSADQWSDADLGVVLTWLGSFERPASGQGLWVEFCGNCHGARGGGGPVDEGVRGADLDEFLEVVRDGEGGHNYGDRGDYMPNWAPNRLSDDEVRRAYDYVRR